MSLLTDGVMTEDEGFMLEAADQCGMVNTDDDCEHMRGSIKNVVLFGRMMQRAGMFRIQKAFIPDGTTEHQDIESTMEAIDAVAGPLIEQERVEWLAWYDALPPAKPPYSGKDSGISLDSIIDEVLLLGSGDPEAALELLVEWRAGLA